MIPDFKTAAEVDVVGSAWEWCNQLIIKLPLFMFICDGSSGILHCSVDICSVTQLALYVDLSAAKVIRPVILLFINLRSFPWW